MFPQIEIISCADVVAAAAETRAKEFGIRAQTPETLISDSEIELVLNLTTPQSHAPVSLQALQAGKHVYSEKPLALSTEEAQPLLAEAKQRNLRIGCAPDTFLGGGQQTARNVIDSGAIGTPIAGTAAMMVPGHERWHPNPDFFYQPGGGPVFDMGPYYITALVNLFGPIAQVHSVARKGFEQRSIATGPRQGQTFPVTILTHFHSLLEFETGPVVSFVASFDIQVHSQVPIELYGTKGTLQVPDPNIFGGNVRIFGSKQRWLDIAHTHGFGDQDYRSIGLVEMVDSIAAGRHHRASETLAYHVLEVIEAIVQGGATDGAIKSRCERPAPLRLRPPLRVIE